jgi:mRNA interferase MazF
MVLLDSADEDVILCQITSRPVGDSHAVPIDSHDFANGSLRLDSNVRPNKLFTFSRTRIITTCGRLNPRKTIEIVDRLIALLR